MIKHRQSSVLPFTVLDASRKGKFFPSDVELSAIVCLAERERKKSGLIGGSSENISFISRIHYPLWAVPWEDKCLIVDGLGKASSTDNYSVPPHIELFIEDLLRNSYSKKRFLDALEKHNATFKNFISTNAISFNTIIVNRDFLHVLFEHIKERKPIEGEHEISAIPIEISEKAALDEGNEYIQHWRQVLADIRGFQYATSVLKEESRLHQRLIIMETRLLRENYRRKISHLKHAVEKNSKELTKIQEVKIAETTESAQRKQRSASKKKDKYEHRMEVLRKKEILLQERTVIFEHKGDVSRADRSSYELGRIRNEIEETERKIRDFSSLIERISKESQNTVKEVNERYKRIIEKEDAKITNLRALRDSKIVNSQREMEELLSRSSYIRSLIIQLIERKTMDCKRIQEENAIPWKRKDVTLIYVPLYLVKYQRMMETRYNVYLPMLVMGYEGMLGAVKKAILRYSFKTRIGLLIHPKSGALGKILGSILIKRIVEDKAFDEKISNICASANLINSLKFKDMLKSGINELAAEGWLTSSEVTEILGRYEGV